jgi:hypothetical protein
MADEPQTAGWVLPSKGTGNGDVQFSNTLPGGANMPYGSLGAQLLDAMRISRLLPGAPGGAYQNNRYNFSNFSPNWPGGGFPLPGGTGTGVGTGGGGTGGGGFNPGGGGPAGGGLGGGGSGGGLLNPPPGNGNAPGGVVVHGNDPAGTGNNQWGPYAPPAAGVGDWQSSVNKVLGQGDPVQLIQNAIKAHVLPGVKTFAGTQTNYDPMTLNTLRTQFTAAGMNPYAAAKLVEAFGNSGQDAYSAAEQLGLLGQFTAGGQQGLRPATPWVK